MLASRGARCLIFAGLTVAFGSEYAQWHHRAVDDDLFTFVTRPDLRPPRFNIALNKRERTAPGYIFVAPYDCLECNNAPVTTHITQQVGPHIYTQDGELVWSGDELFPGTKVFDFKAVIINGEHHLSLIAPPDSHWQPYPDGAVMLLNSSYQPVFSLGSNELGRAIDMHEFNVLKDGRSALVVTKGHREPRESDSEAWKGQLLDGGFTEINMSTHEPIFDWIASDHIPFPDLLTTEINLSKEVEPSDWFKLNSVDKDRFGNYLVSSRATNTIYYLAANGTVLWRLGGPNSSFKKDFEFSRQHDARVQDQNEVNMVISFFDNAADASGQWQPTSSSSSLKVVGLDLENMVATLYHVHVRPDGGLTETHGNMQFLPNGGVFGGWGENGYMTEYVNRGGEKLYEASFASRRFTNYRAYKMEFVGRPNTEPITKAVVSTDSRRHPKTTFYVSWNGATEVKKWRFFAHSVSKRGVAWDVKIGETAKTGFETSFTTSGHHLVYFAEALDALGNVLAKSPLEVAEIPPGFHDVDKPMYTEESTASTFSLQTAVVFFVGFIIATIRERFWVGKNKGGVRFASIRSLHWDSKRNKFK